MLLNQIISLFYFLVQAYTVELEAELNQLKEENTQLKQALVSVIQLHIYTFVLSYTHNNVIDKGVFACF